VEEETVTEDERQVMSNVAYDDEDSSDYGNSRVREDDMKGTVWRREDGSFEIGMKVPMPPEKMKAIEEATSFETAIRIMNEEIRAHRDRRRGISTGLTGPQATADYFASLDAIRQERERAAAAAAAAEAPVAPAPTPSAASERTAPAPEPVAPRQLAPAALPPSPTSTPEPSNDGAHVLRQLVEAENQRYHYMQEKLLHEHNRRIQDILAHF